MNYKLMYEESEVKFQRLISDSREKITMIVDKARKREDALMERAKEQVLEMKKYKDVVVGMQKKQQALRMQQQFAGCDVPKAE